MEEEERKKKKKTEKVRNIEKGERWIERKVGRFLACPSINIKSFKQNISFKLLDTL